MYLAGPEALRYTPDEARAAPVRPHARRDLGGDPARAGSTGDFRPNPEPVCAWCGHKELCPAWDGTPPPYPGWPADARRPKPD